MKSFAVPVLLACAVALPCAAQSTASKPAAKKPAPTRKAAPVKPAAPVLKPADDEQLAAARLAYLGIYDCEFNQSIRIEPHVAVPGYIDVVFNKATYVMKPVLSSTGALRLEDVTGRTLMIQIANKSMLMDTKIGQRLVDECIHPTQRAAIDAAKANPQPPSTTLGIDPARVAAVAAAAASAASAAATQAASAAGAAASAAQAVVQSVPSGPGASAPR